MKIFWSWQSDRDRKCCQYFVRDALKAASDQIATELSIEERPAVDHDTKGVTGTPPITDTIFEKIRESAVFVADVTPIGMSDSENEDANKKRLPNPNVMIELGFAEAVLGGSKILCVANDCWYRGPESLPFDLRHRRGPLTYSLPPDSEPSARKEAAQKLTLELRDRLRPILIAQSELGVPTLDERRQPFVEHEAVWSLTDHPAAYQDTSAGGQLKEFHIIRNVPRLYARIYPRSWKPPRNRLLLEKLRTKGFAWIGRARCGDCGINADGAVQFFFNNTDPLALPQADAVTQWFASNGEIWATDCSAFLDKQDGKPLFAYQYAFLHLCRFLPKTIPALEDCGAGPPFEVRLGAAKLSGSLWAARLRSKRYEAVRDKVEVCASHSIWSAAEWQQLLFEFWNAITDGYGFDETETLQEFESAVGLTRSPLS